MIDFLKYDNQKRNEFERNFFSILYFFNNKNVQYHSYDCQLIKDLIYQTQKIQVIYNSEKKEDNITNLKNEEDKERNLEEKGKKSMIILESNNIDKSIDQIFAEFLNKISSFVNVVFYQKIVFVLILLRDCLNTFYFKLNLSRLSQLSELTDSTLFTQCYNAEHVPEISNYFVLEYLDRKSIYSIFASIQTSKEEIIAIIKNFCHWLFLNDYTSFKLSVA